MAVELKVLGYAALLQFVQFIVMAVPVNLQLGVAYTGGNRDEQQQATGVPGRLKRALDNHFEGLVLFTIAVLVVVLGESGTSSFGLIQSGALEASNVDLTAQLVSMILLSWMCQAPRFQRTDSTKSRHF